LIRREESELAAAQGGGYAAYRARVPRLMPSPVPRIPSAGRPPDWAGGFRAELWYWGFALAVIFFAILAASVATLFVGSHR
jgi:hypothetical protein